MRDDAFDRHGWRMSTRRPERRFLEARGWQELPWAGVWQSPGEPLLRDKTVPLQMSHEFVVEFSASHGLAAFARMVRDVEASGDDVVTHDRVERWKGA